MEGSFDPYRKWLGIPQQEQPPHHYRLLGIEPFEADSDVISHAADARMVHLKTFQTGQYAAHSQKLLNEVSTALVCLLNPLKKAEYDAQLRERLASGGVVPPPPPPVPPPQAPPLQPPPYQAPSNQPPPSGVASDRLITADVPSVQPSSGPRGPRYVPRRQRPTWMLSVLILAGIISLLVVLIAVLGPSLGSREDEVPSSRRNSQTPQTRRDDRKPAPTSPRPNPRRPRPDRPPPNAPDFPIMDMSAGNDTEAPSDPIMEGMSPSDATADNSDSPDNPSSPVDQPNSGKLLPPDSLLQEAAERRIREDIRGELQAARTAEQKLTLAGKLLDEADSSDDASERFARMQIGCELAASSGNLQETMDLVDRFSDAYKIDPWNTKVAMLPKLVNANRKASPGETRHLTAATFQLIDQAVAEDRFAAANRLTGAIRSVVAGRTGDKRLADYLNDRRQEIGWKTSRFADVRQSLETLQEKPDDPTANETAGRWYGFVRQDWEKGLPLLAQAADPALAEAAKHDLANPTDAAARMKLADDWRALAESPRGAANFEKLGVRLRAQHWYRQALPDLAGADKNKVNQRLVAIAEAANGQLRGTVQAGNVALATCGATITGQIKQPAELLNGKTDQLVNGGRASADWPCEWVITLDKVYQLQEIRLILWNAGKARIYRYRIETSADGETFTPLVDRSQGQWFGMQQIPFRPSRPVTAIKVVGLSCSVGQAFQAVELEAYCIAPDLPGRR